MRKGLSSFSVIAVGALVALQPSTASAAAALRCVPESVEIINNVKVTNSGTVIIGKDSEISVKVLSDAAFHYKLPANLAVGATVSVPVAKPYPGSVTCTATVTTLKAVLTTSTTINTVTSGTTTTLGIAGTVFLPDLVFTDMRLCTANKDRGIEVAVKNAGAAAAKSASKISYKVEILNNPIFGTSAVLGTTQVAYPTEGLAVGAVRDNVIPWTNPTDEKVKNLIFKACSPNYGTFKFKVSVDTANVLKEKDETNNSKEAVFGTAELPR